ncbi:MAG: hypothetical protein FJW39_00615 [Acidobacteria bacterium]|nr:hypothetical protein [Acidobacteriota bacterium]
MWSLALLPLAFQAAPPGDQIRKTLVRVSEEAEAFYQAAPRVVSREKLSHKGRRTPKRFQARPGASAADIPAAGYHQRELVSEFGFGFFRDSPDDLREFRQVVEVNGRPVVKPEKARQTLAFNMTSENDRSRKKMLEDFEKHGLIGAASDLSQAILLFRRGKLEQLEFSYVRSDVAGVDAALVYRYKQTSGDGMRVYDDKALQRPKMEGELWVRRRDSVPLRITFDILTEEYKQPVKHWAEVDYEPSRMHGILLPGRVRYRRWLKDELMVENTAVYSGYRMFKVEAGITFTPAEEVKPQP